MFIKNNKISCLVICTSMFDDEEILYLKREFAGSLPLVFFIPYDEEIPTPLSSGDLIVKEAFMDRCFTYKGVLKKIVTLTNIPSNECVFISKNIQFIKKALHEPVGTIWISNGKLSYDVIGHLPDKNISGIEELKKAVDIRHGYFSEVFATILKDNEYYNKSGLFFTFEVSREDVEFEVFAAGRYFNSRHECFHSHQLSHRINKSKRDGSQNNLFKTLYIAIVKKIKDLYDVNGIVRVPNRPGKRDRLGPIVRDIAKHTSLDDFSSEVICVKDYPAQKILDKEMRYENVKGVFRVERRLDNKHIVIIDDVFTSGATVFECAKQLYLAGASKVTVVVLGVNQFSNEFVIQRHATCPKCGGRMLLRINSRTNVAFYGCEKFYDRENHCAYTEDFLSGWYRIIEENSIKSVGEEQQEDWLF